MTEVGRAALVGRALRIIPGDILRNPRIYHDTSWLFHLYALGHSIEINGTYWHLVLVMSGISISPSSTSHGLSFLANSECFFGPNWQIQDRLRWPGWPIKHDQAKKTVDCDPALDGYRVIDESHSGKVWTTSKSPFEGAFRCLKLYWRKFQGCRRLFLPMIWRRRGNREDSRTCGLEKFSDYIG